MNNTKYIIVGIIGLVLFLFNGCTSCSHKAIEGIESNLSIYRFDTLFYSINSPSELAPTLEKIKGQEDDFYDLYISKIYSIDPNDLNVDAVIYHHINSAQNQEIRKIISEKMGSFEMLQSELSLLSRYYQLYYPQRKFPQIYTCYSGFAGFMAWLYNDSCMLVDLDMYLGNDFEAYPQFYPQFKFQYFEKEFLAQNVCTELIRREFTNYEKDKPKHMLAFMLIEGAKIYEQSKLMPCREVSKLFEYSPSQWEWAKREERNIWQYLIKENLLYNSDYKEYRPLVGEAPASIRSGVADGAPPRIAIFAGYQIVKKFMEESQVMDAYEMFKKYGPEDILKMAKYKP